MCRSDSASAPCSTAVDCTVDDGEVVALLGPSGSGKSTVLRVVAGLLQPDSGRGVARRRRHHRACPRTAATSGMVFQDEQLFPHLDVAAQRRLRACGCTDGRTSHGHGRVAELLDLVGLAGFGNASVDRLSGGEAKRVALARSLAPRPAVLLLDEPLTGLDRELHDRSHRRARRRAARHRNDCRDGDARSRRSDVRVGKQVTRRLE